MPFYILELIKRTKPGKNIVYGNGGDEELSTERCLERMLYDDVINTSAWAKLYETEMVRKFPYPVGKLFEDIATTYTIFLPFSNTTVCVHSDMRVWYFSINEYRYSTYVSVT